MQTVYIDVLIALNLLLTWAMLRACGELCHRAARKGRMALASGIGGISSLVILLPELPWGALLVLRLLLSGLLIRAAFRWEGWRQLARMAGLLFAVSLLFAGGTAAVWSLFAPRGIALRNGTVYFHIPAWMLAGAATVGYLAARGVGAALEKRMPSALTEDYVASVNGRDAPLRLLTDTGNRLTFSGRPVAVIGTKAAGFLPPEAAAAAEDITIAASGKLKLIPCRTAAGEKLLPGVEARLTRRRDGAVFPCILAVTAENCFPGALDGKEGADGVIGVVN